MRPFDPQYRGVLDKMRYGNEGQRRGRRRSALPQMDGDVIAEFIARIEPALTPSGHLFLWVDKYHLCSGVEDWLEGTGLEIVDLVTWNKGRMGMGYRTRRCVEYLMIIQKPPVRVNEGWKKREIPDVWTERVRPERGGSPPKPVHLQTALIEAVTEAGDVVVDPAGRELLGDGGGASRWAAISGLRRQFRIANGRSGCGVNGCQRPGRRTWLASLRRPARIQNPGNFLSGTGFSPLAADLRPLHGPGRRRLLRRGRPGGGR